MLGVVVAAWPAARLIGEPIFGWVADRTRRVPLMVAGNILSGIFLFLPIVFVGIAPFTVLRALAGLSTAMYDPAARGYITDSTPEDRRGEAFGLYGAAQMGGLLLGPAIGGLGASIFGGVAFIFAFGAVSSFLAALAIALRVRERPHTTSERMPAMDLSELGAAQTEPLRGRANASVGETHAGSDRGGMAPPTSLVNRWLLAGVLFTVGGNFAFGTYEVVWSLWLQSLGAGLGLIGLTFAMFGLPVLVLSPFFGRRMDRGSLTPYLLAGTVLPVLAALSYTLISDPVLAVPLILVEATGAAIGGPAEFSVIALGSPVDRPSTAQGIVGASGTLGFVIASLVAGAAAEMSIRTPFYLLAIVTAGLWSAAFVVGWPRLRARAVAMSTASAEAA
jgi:MFS family permease